MPPATTRRCASSEVPSPRAKEWSAAAVEGLGEVLEVASGTGRFTVAIAPQVGRLVATDFAKAMVEQTQARVEAAGLTKVRCESRTWSRFPGQRRFSLRSLTKALEAAGFRIVKAEAIPGLIPIGFVEAEKV